MECRRAFSHLSVHHLERLLKHTGAGSEAELLDQLVWGTFSEFAFLTSAQVALVLLVQGSHLAHWVLWQEEQWPPMAVPVLPPWNLRLYGARWQRGIKVWDVMNS